MECKNVVINRSDAIGDTLLTMPMAALIKEKFPDSKIIFIISEKCKDLFNHHPYIDDVWVLDHSLPFFKKLIFFFKKFREFKPDTYFHVGGSFYPTYVAWITKVNFRGGLKSRLLSFLYLNHGVRQSRSHITMHESEYNMNLLAPAGIEYEAINRSQYAPKIDLTSEEVKASMDSFKVDLRLNNLPDNLPLIFIHPGMTGHTLNWASRNYARLVERIHRNHAGKFLFVISHTPGDSKYIDVFKNHIQTNKDGVENFLYYFDGTKKGLMHYMAVLSKAALMIAPSTGNTHIANALEVPQITIYSPIKVQSALRWGPFQRSEQTDIMVPDVVCGQNKVCAGDVCPYYECMAKIEVEDVYQNVLKKLQRFL